MTRTAEHPSDFVGSMEEVKKAKAWLAFTVLGLYGLCRVLGKLSKYWNKLAVLDHGYPSVIIAGGGTVLAAGVDAFFLGGTLVTVAFAMFYALIGMLGVKKATT